MAERGGFEPPNPVSRITVFETAAFNRSATSPRGAPQGDSLAAGSSARLVCRATANPDEREVAEREGFEPSR